MLAQGLENNLGQMISKAWSDPIFKERLKDDPKVVLTEVGIETPEGVEIEVVENTAEKAYLTLPMTPSMDVLSDKDLEIGPTSTACLPGNTGCQTADWGCS